jgi:hypothetical protein
VTGGTNPSIPALTTAVTAITTLWSTTSLLTLHTRSHSPFKALCLKRGYHWRVIKLLLTAFALGLASLDVTGALAAVGALGAGARVRALVAFGCFSILGTVAFGTALSLIVGPRIVGFDWDMLLPHDPTEDRVAASVNVVV